MRFLYISHLGSDKATGLCWSVPSGISSQETLDECFWINTLGCSFNHWETVKAFHRLDSFDEPLSLKLIQKVFPNPDVVVFEGFYQIEALFLAKELYRAHIPYVIVPRGSLTRQAFHNHNFFNYIKKKIAVALLFRRYTKRALSIQYLTKSEYEDSGDRWNNRHYIIPNGINMPTKYKTSFTNDEINIVFIGRPTIYHKGLDILIDALKRDISYFEHKLIVNCYVPKKNDYDELVRLVQETGVERLFIIHSAVYDNEKENVILNSDVFIMTSRFEGHPMGLIEALSYGIPVAVTPGTNMADEVLEYNSGWVASCDSDSICDMLKRILAEKEHFKTKGQNARVLASKYEWTKLAERFHSQMSLYLGKS